MPWDTNLIFGKGHVDENITDEDQHYSEDREWQGLSVIVKVLSNIDIIESD